LITILFLGVALSISSVKIVAMVVREMGFMRRDLGQIIIASAIIEDSVGWIIIAVIFGIARAGRIEIISTLESIAGVAVFLAASFTVGRRAVSASIRFVNDFMTSELPVITLILIIMGGMALISDALGVQTVLGAFVAGILIGESPMLTKHIDDRLRGIVVAFFAPVFFALAGLGADLTVLRSPQIAGLTLGLVLIASIGKFGGALLGGLVGRLTSRESTALAIGMNARGSTEVIVASIGLSLGVLSQSLYSMIVTMAVITTVAMPPTLRWALSRVPLRAGEQERLEREAFEARGFVNNMERLLLAASDSANGRLASRIAGLLAGRRGLPTTVLHIEAAGGGGTGKVDAAARSANELTDNVRQGAGQARSAPTAAGDGEPGAPVVVETRSEHSGPENAVAIAGPKGYDFLIVGLDLAGTLDGGFSAEIAKTVRAYEGPLAVVAARGALMDDPRRGRLKMLVPVTGTDTAKRAAEIAIEIARSTNAEMIVLYVASRQFSANADLMGRRRILERRYEEAVLKDIVDIADHNGVEVRTKVAVADHPHAAILDEAKKTGATLVVLGVSTRPTEALLFGNTANRLMEEGRQSLLLVAS
jgi:Kef-type K+ transport system membrane component KefB/nucleotide-binding universal stress UspA family protein